MFLERGRFDTERERRDPLYPFKGTSEMNDTKGDGAFCCRHEEVRFNTTFRDFEIYQEIRNNRVPSAWPWMTCMSLTLILGPAGRAGKVGSETGPHTNSFGHMQLERPKFMVLLLFSPLPLLGENTEFLRLVPLTFKVSSSRYSLKLKNCALPETLKTSQPAWPGSTACPAPSSQRPFVLPPRPTPREEGLRVWLQPG